MTALSDQMLFKEFYFELWWLFCKAEHTPLGNFGRMPYEEHLCEIILNFGQQLRRCHLKIFLVLALVAILFGVEQFGQF